MIVCACAVSILRNMDQALLFCLLGWLCASVNLPLACSFSLQCRRGFVFVYVFGGGGVGLPEVSKMGATEGTTFFRPLLSLSWYCLSSFGPRLTTSLVDTMHS
jgi:hypothetical protein